MDKLINESEENKKLWNKTVDDIITFINSRDIVEDTSKIIVNKSEEHINNLTKKSSHIDSEVIKYKKYIEELEKNKITVEEEISYAKYNTENGINLDIKSEYFDQNFFMYSSRKIAELFAILLSNVSNIANKVVIEQKVNEENINVQSIYVTNKEFSNLTLNEQNLLEESGDIIIIYRNPVRTGSYYLSDVNLSQIVPEFNQNYHIGDYRNYVFVNDNFVYKNELVNFVKFLVMFNMNLNPFYHGNNNDLINIYLENEKNKIR